jgi:hypothetical protein
MTAMADFTGFPDIGDELMARLRGLLPDEYLRDLDLYLGCGEEGLFADLLAHALVAHRVPIGRSTQELLVRLLAYFPDTGDAQSYPHVYNRDATLAALNVVDEP